MIPDIIKMQTRAILEGRRRNVQNDGVQGPPEIMIPLVGHVNELTRTRQIARSRGAR